MNISLKNQANLLIHWFSSFVYHFSDTAPVVRKMKQDRKSLRSVELHKDRLKRLESTLADTVSRGLIAGLGGGASNNDGSVGDAEAALNENISALLHGMAQASVDAADSKLSALERRMIVRRRVAMLQAMQFAKRARISSEQKIAPAEKASLLHGGGAGGARIGQGLVDARR